MLGRYLSAAVDLTIVCVVQSVGPITNPIFHHELFWGIAALSRYTGHVHDITQIQCQILAEVLVLCRPRTPA